MDKIKFKYLKLIDEAYILYENFDLKRARKLKKEIEKLSKSIPILIREHETTLNLVAFNENQEMKEEVEENLEQLNLLAKFNQTVLEYDVITPVGYNLFIQDVINLYPLEQ